MNRRMSNFGILFALVSVLLYVQLMKTAEGVSPSKFSIADRYRTNVDPFSFLNVFDNILKKYKPIDLGFGEIDFNPPKFIQSALAEAATSDDYRLNQYTDIAGLPRLLKAVSALYSKLLNHTLHPNKNVIITVGATEALYAAFEAYTHPKDEWILIEPYYFAYIPMIKSAGGVPRFVTLKPSKTRGKISSADWIFNREELSNLFNNKTKGIVVNSPNNPIGKVFTLEELSFIADLAKKWNTLVIYDAVYQFLTFDRSKHIEIATLPGMFERTISVGSASKMLGVTGYRVGWAYGPTDLIKNLKLVHSIFVVNAPVPNQEAVAIVVEKEIANFGKPHSYLETFKRETQAKRDYMYEILSECGMTPTLPEGGYYIIANWTTMNDVKLDEGSKNPKDYEFDKWLVKNVKIHGLPISVFYGDEHKHMNEDSLRFVMIKKNETLKKVHHFIKKWKIQSILKSGST